MDMRNTIFLTVATLGLATLVSAHSGVTNPAVMARMESMKATQDSTKLLGAMAKGERAFDAAEARKAAAEIARHAAETPALFEAREDDPKSEALPAIWEDFDDFTQKSVALERLAIELSETIETEEQLRAGLGRIGAACKSCHQDYRK